MEFNIPSFFPLASPNIQDLDIDAAIKVLKSGNLVQGMEVEQFELAIAKYIGVKHAICVSNGTATLHLSLLALGIGPGDEVIVPAFSYIATANVVELVGATPIFVDIDINTFNINVNKIERKITTKTKAIIPVHEFGLSCNISEIVKIADKHNLFIIEDAACALGATHFTQKVGSFGKLGSFSFHPRKAITSGEGGIITTNDDDLAAKLKSLRNHGINYVDGKMDFVLAGFNYRMTDFQAALVNSQLNRIDKIITIKNKLAEVYFNEINNPIITLPTVPKNYYHTWQTFHVLLDESLKQDIVIKILNERGIGTNYGAQCMPYQTFYKNKYKLNCELETPNALNVFKKGLAIPIYEKLTEMDIKFIAQEINKL